MKYILIIVPALIPTVYISILTPFEALKKQRVLDYQIVLVEDFESKMLERIDLIVFCRNSGWYEEHILETVLKHNIPYIYDIDDNFFDIASSNDLGKFHRHPLNISALKLFLKHASLVRLYSPLMVDNVRPINDKIELNRAYFNTALLAGVIAKHTDKIKIIYATSRIADEQQSIFLEALQKISLEFEKNVEIYFWGAPIVDEELKQRANVFYLEPINDYQTFIQSFYEMGFDIGLAPIFGERFYNSKTNNKYREYGGCKIAGIYSDEPLYQSCIIHANNGLLAENTPDSWYQAIKQLILDKELRENIINHAYDDVIKNYSFEHFCDQWKISIQKALHYPVENFQSSPTMKQNATMDLIVLYDYSSIDFCILKDKVSNNVYKDTSITLHPIEITQENMADYAKYDIYNIILLTNDQLILDYFSHQCKSIPNFRLLIITHKDLQFRKNLSNLKWLHIPSNNSELKNIYTYFTYNIYIEIHEIVKSFFEYNKPVIPKKEFIIVRILKKIRNYICYPKMLLQKLYVLKAK